MRSVLLSVLAAALPSLAYPINQNQQCDAWQTWPGQVLSFDPYLAQVRFTLPCQECLSPTSASHDESLVFSAYLSQCYDSTDAQCHKLILNDHEVASTEDSNQTPSSLVLFVDNGSSDKHRVSLTATPVISPFLYVEDDQPKYLTARLALSDIDGTPVTQQFSVSFDISKPQTKALLDSPDGKVELLHPQSYCTIMTDRQDKLDSKSEEAYLAQEIEAIKLLEQDVSRLQQEIASRKNAASVRLAQYHSHVPLEELMSRCDGIACSAKAIANRLYEKLTLALDSHNGYESLQAPVTTTSKSFDGQEANVTSHTGNELPSLEHTTTNILLQALTCVASVLGLATLFAFIRRRCMSMRTRAERAADLEERRNARAYRRAACRAKIHRRWSAFQSLFVCRKHNTIPSNSNYDEKRALILQDALLEERPEQMEKGDIMEAEIRQLRHAHSILSGIIHPSDGKPDDNILVKDPPPNLVPLPYSSSRSRSSTNTLPSYDSDSLPDYSSLPGDLELGIHVSDGFAQYSPPSSEADDRDYQSHAAATCQPRAPNSVSSVAALSPRASNETLRTRTTLRSRAGSHEMPR